MYPSLFYTLTLNDNYSECSTEEITTLFNENNKFILFDGFTSHGVNTFELLSLVNHDAIGAVPDSNFSITQFGTNRPEGLIHLYYGFDSLNKQFLDAFPGTINGDRGNTSRYYHPEILLNKCCNFTFSQLGKDSHFRKSRYYGKLDSTPGLEVLVKYASKLQIIQFYTKQLNNFQQMYNRAINADQKIAAIIVFVSVLEGDHFFQNGNNRTFIQVLLCKCLIEAELEPSILRIPNGFSSLVLCTLPESVRFGSNSLN